MAQMKIRNLICACVVAILLSQAALSQQNVSVDQLREQIAKLTAINNDPATSSEVRKINLGFLEERRKQLLDLLRRKLDALKTYQTNVKGILSTAEEQLVAKSIGEAENEIRELGGKLEP